MGEEVSSGSAGRRVLLRAAGAAWPALALYLGMWPAGLAGEWPAVWLFFFSGSALAVALYRARYVRDRARALDLRPTSEGLEKFMRETPDAEELLAEAEEHFSAHPDEPGRSAD